MSNIVINASELAISPAAALFQRLLSKHRGFLLSIVWT
jgi:hypothetical protein